MFFILRFFFYFSLSFIILSIPIHKQAIFFHLEGITSPLLSPLMENLSEAFEKTAKTGKQLYSNSEPRNRNERLSDFEQNIEN